MSRPRALDLYSGAGGAARGLQVAGFHVTGVDLRDQPRYAGDAFVRADALQSPFDLRAWDLIWASPPCQRFSAGAQWRKSTHNHPDLIGPTRAMLLAAGVPFVIENVPRAPVRKDLVLRGEMFGLKVCRERAFELGGWWCLQPQVPFRGSVKRGDFVTVAGHGGDGSNSLRVWREAIGIDWMSKEETAEAVPLAYSAFIGRAFLAWRSALQEAA